MTAQFQKNFKATKPAASKGVDEEGAKLRRKIMEHKKQLEKREAIEDAKLAS